MPELLTPAGIILACVAFAAAWLLAPRHLLQFLHKYRDQRAILEASPVPIGLVDHRGRIVYLNKAYGRTLGYTLEDIPTIEDWYRQAYPDLQYRESITARWRNSLEEYQRTQTAFAPIEANIRCKNGETRIFMISAEMLDGSSTGDILASFYDITEHVIATAKIQRLSKLYAALSRCNEAIVRSGGDQVLFQKICQVTVELGGMKMAWIGMVEGATRQVTVVAKFGGGTEYLDEIRISVDADDPNGQGPTGTSIRDNQPYWCQDFLHDPHTSHWTTIGATYGWKASASIPISREGKPVGALTIYADQINAFDEDAQRLLTEMAMDIGFALDNFARETQRKKDQAILLENKNLLEIAGRTARLGGWQISAPWECVEWSDQVCDIHEMPHGSSPTMEEGISFYAPEHIDTIRAVIGKCIAHGTPFDEELEIITAHGRRVWVRAIGIAIRDDQGNITKIQGAFQDISSFKEAISSLIDSEQRFRSLVEQSLAGTYIIQDGKIVYVNPRLKEILGYPADESPIGRNPLDSIAEKDRDMVRQHLLDLAAGKAQSPSLVFTALRKDGGTVEVGVNSTLAKYQQRDAIIGLMQDITDRKVAEEQIQRYTEKLQNAFMQTVGLATTLSEMRDPYTAGHERRVAELAVTIGKAMGLDEQKLVGLRVGGYLHDVGKTAIPVEILSKPGKISPVEYELIKSHPRAGYEVLKDVEFPWPVALIALQHHERMDGSGYPQGLKGEEILLEARIIAVADVLEAMASHRPYRPGLGIEAALEEVEKNRGLKYDLAVVDACIRLFRESGYQLPT